MSRFTYKLVLRYCIVHIVPNHIQHIMTIHGLLQSLFGISKTLNPKPLNPIHMGNHGIL